MNNSTFNDPLDELINKHKAANGETVEIPLEPETPVAEPAAEEPNNGVQDIDFGDNDLEAEIAAEDAAREQARREQYEAMKAAREENNPKLAAMPPQPYDEKVQGDEVDFQGDKLGIVTGMVNRVVAKYKLFTGGIPVIKRMQVMGELLDLYHNFGDTISPEFEALIVDNWEMENGQSGREFINSGSNLPTDSASANAETKAEKEAEEIPVTEPTATINVNVPKGVSEVTVNVDGETVQELTTTRTLDIIVNEVSEKDLQVSTIIENSQIEGIIKPYESGLNDVPITLPLSAYRAVMRPISWMDFIKLVSPTAGTHADNELRQWSVIYKHLKNPSIGPFKSFEDFLKHTKYADRELLMWGLLVATADDEETLALTCPNPKCRASITMKYRPRDIIHLDKELIPAKYQDVHEAPAGSPLAIQLHDELANNLKRYRLPDTGIIVDIKEPSAYDFINKKLPLIDSLYKRFKPESDLQDLDYEDPTMAEFDFLSANALYIEAMSVVVPNKDPNKDPLQYRYTNWEDIENILTTALSTDDSAALLKIIQNSKTSTSPVSFRINNINCPRCSHHEDYININNIGNTLLFQVSRRLDNIQINWKEMQLK